MSIEQELLVQEYGKNPLCNFEMKDYSIKQHEGNFICGDDITVYLLIEDNIVKKYSFDGDCSTITTASASFFSEFIIGVSIKEILKRDYSVFTKRGFDVSRKRRRALVMPLMAARNAIHNYISDGKKDNFDDLLE